jgi:hypothetical protein
LGIDGPAPIVADGRPLFGSDLTFEESEPFEQDLVASGRTISTTAAFPAPAAFLTAFIARFLSGMWAYQISFARSPSAAGGLVSSMM